MRRHQLLFPLFFLFALPASTTYELHDAGFGAGGMSVGESNTYGLSAVAGEISGQQGIGSTYNLGPGLQFTRQSNVPPAPTLVNSDNWYNKLAFILATGGNPSDTLYSLAVSTDNFVTTQYVQTDGMIGANPVYQSYSDWGGATGEYVVGLQPNTTYALKVSAVQTKYTESAYSAVATATTNAPSLAFDIDIAASDTETAAPYTLALGALSPGVVTTAPNKVWIDLDSNAVGGSFVYVYGSGTGLTSIAAGHTIPSVSANLAAEQEGYGLQSTTTAQSAGGPLAAVSPYNGAGDNVGIVNTTTRTTLNSSAVPVTAGRASFLLKAISSALTPAASDYTETITVVASATF